MFYSFNLFLIIFLNLFSLKNAGSAYFTNQRQTSSSNGGNSYGEYGQYYGNNRNNDGFEINEWNNGRRKSTNSRILSDKLNKNSEIDNTFGIYTLEEECIEDCSIFCLKKFVTYNRGKEKKVEFICSKLKPPERKLHEKLVSSITNASIFEFFIAGIIVLSILICCICSCYQCFCKNSSISSSNRNNRNQNNNGERIEILNKENKLISPSNGLITNSLNGTTSTGLSPEHDPLVNEKIPHIDEGIHPAPLLNNNGLNHHNHHSYIKTNKFRGNGGGEHSIV